MKDNIGLLLSKRALISPEVDGFVDAQTGARQTFAEQDARANRCAAMLSDIGLRAGDRIALLIHNGAEYIEIFFATAKLGAVAVPLNWRLVADELAYILADCGAEVLVYGGEFAALAESLHHRGTELALRNWVQVGDEHRLPRFALAYESAVRGRSEREPAVGACGDDPLYIMYTSGTTGLPKGVVHTHTSAMWASVTMSPCIDLHYRDRYLVALPLFHVGALAPMTTNVYRGVTNVVMRTFDAEKAWITIERERIAAMLAVPAMLGPMLEVPDWSRYDRSSLRWMMSGAAPVPVTLIETFASHGIEILQVYGLTETCGPACVINGDDALRKAGSTGKPFFHTDVRIVDGDGNDCEPNQAGEVLVRGKHLMAGYWNREDATREVLRDGWLHTGDVARADSEGFVFIQDRIKDMIISGGENVYPAEVENVILSHPGVRDVGVIGQPSAKWGESAVAVVVKADAALQDSDVLAHCRSRLARYKNPVAVEFIDEIPRNPSGKILKRMLRERFPGPASE